MKLRLSKWHWSEDHFCCTNSFMEQIDRCINIGVFQKISKTFSLIFRIKSKRALWRFNCNEKIIVLLSTMWAWAYFIQEEEMKNMLFHVSGFFFYHLLTSSYELIIYNRFFCKVCLEVFFLIKVTPVSYTHLTLPTILLV